MSKRKGKTKPKRTFKQVRVDEGVLRLVPLPPAMRAKKDRFEQMIAAAGRSHCASPIYSGFYVNGAIAAEGDKILHGANKEYGDDQALHCEEDLVATLVSSMNSAERARTAKVMLAFSCGEGAPGVYPLPTCCGNCRDFLRDMLAPTTIIISGTQNGGLATVATLADLLYTDYMPVAKRDWAKAMPDSLMDTIVAEAGRLAYHPYKNAAKFPLRKYAAMVKTNSKGVMNSYFGAIANGADFHPLYALEDALRAAQRNGDPYVESVVIVAEGDGSEPPDVMSRDRQRLMEAALDAELLTGKPCNPKIILVTYADGATTGVWETFSDEWLPFPFSPKEFGEEFLKGHVEYLRKKYGVN